MITDNRYVTELAMFTTALVTGNWKCMNGSTVNDHLKSSCTVYRLINAMTSYWYSCPIYTVGKEILDSLILFRILNLRLDINFHIVRYVCIHYSIAQKFSFGFNFHTHVNLRKINPYEKTSPTV